MNPSTRITIHKLDAQGKELWQYSGVLLERVDNRITLEAIFDRDAVDIEGLALQRGDRFVETFFLDRWFNIFTVFDGTSGNLKGWYCNIARPARLEKTHLYAEDLALDLIVFPDKKFTLVDEEEFNDLDIPSHDRIKALEALDKIKELAMKAEAPFNLLEAFIDADPSQDS